MDINYFKENFVDYLSKDKINATIELAHCEHWDKTRYAIVYDVSKSGRKLILRTNENDAFISDFIFDSADLFKDVDEVVFELNGKEISEYTLVDISWGDKLFVFETDFNKYGV